MIVVIGGAFQGKKEFVKKEYKLKDEDFFLCGEKDLSFDKKVICYIDLWILSEVKKGRFPCEKIEEMLPKLEDKIIICNEVGLGIVPIERQERIFREQVGKTLQILCRRAKKVNRIYCSIKEVIKE